MSKCLISRKFEQTVVAREKDFASVEKFKT